MAVVDILMPAYSEPDQLVENTVKRMVDYSLCKCALVEYGVCHAMAEANQKGRIYKGAVDPSVFHHPSECHNGKHDVFYQPTYGGCILHWSRNALVMQMRPDATHALFCDADIVPEPHYLDQMLDHDKPIISGVLVKRVDPPEPTMRVWQDQLQKFGNLLSWPTDKPLIQVDGFGTGFILVKREVFELMALAYHRERFQRTGNGWWFEHLPNPQLGEWGEDISFCFKAMRLGIPMFVDLTIKPKHIGKYYYDIEDFEPYRKERIEGMGVDVDELRHIETVQVSGQVNP
jgi:hypothetical protein